MSHARFVVGIDLGTTNSAVAYVDTGVGEDARARVLAIPQVVQPGQVESLPLLPSFLYLPGPNEQPAGSLKLPWDEQRDYAVGTFARQFGSQVPTRLVTSAKSWLCHPDIDRRSPILPWQAPADTRKLSPLDAITCYLQHLCEAWNDAMASDVPDYRLEKQEIVLTVPASFDAAARELTVEAARAAGLQQLTLLEEPQSAFYAWLDQCGDQWREQVKVGDLILVADVGGGTTDFTLIQVGEEDGQLALTRLAVGEHLLLGGDNMDLTLAYLASRQLAEQGAKLDLQQMQQLSYSCRQAKETLFAHPEQSSAMVTVLGRGSRLIGGTLKTELMRAEIEQVILDGFFPACDADALPTRQSKVGFQEMGLPYVSDPAMTKHLAYFLTRQTDALAEEGTTQRHLPSAILFNGGVFKAEVLRQRVLEILNGWASAGGAETIRALGGIDLDVAVARGAAYYGLVRRGKGVRIRGGTARAYYIGVETALPAVPGMPPPLKALCVAPFGMEEGTETDLPRQEFALVVGEPAQFRFLASTVRRQDTPGTVVEHWEDEIEELAPLTTTLESDDPNLRQVPVHLHSRVSEVGQLELSCQSRDGKQSWKLEFNVREKG